ncbi:MAG: glucose-1-phosphate adenylyltransferase family protein [bacterium]
MKSVLALILAGGRVDELSVLTLYRPKSAVPFGGMYRVIDFPLSNLMHSGIERVGILSQYRSFSLIHHVGIGTWWDFVGRDRGATMLLPSTRHKASDWYKGNADAVYQNLEFVKEQKPETVMVLSGDHIYKMDYSKMVEVHRRKEADLTIGFAAIDPAESSRFGVAEMDDDAGAAGGWVVDYQEKPAASDYQWASLTIYLFKPDVLYDVLGPSGWRRASHEFGRHIIPSMLGKYQIYGYKFSGYWGYTRTIDEYWQTNMDLLGEAAKIDLEQWQVRTNLDHDRLRDRPPARIAPSAEFSNSLLHNGCEVEGRVENSILFAGVKVARGATVRNSILFFDTRVESGAVLDKTITDFDVRIGADCSVGDGKAATANAEFAGLLSTGITLVGKGAQLPPGLRLGCNCIVAPGLKGHDFKYGQYESGMTIR